MKLKNKFKCYSAYIIFNHPYYFALTFFIVLASLILSIVPMVWSSNPLVPKVFLPVIILIFLLIVMTVMICSTPDKDSSYSADGTDYKFKVPKQVAMDSEVQTDLKDFVKLIKSIQLVEYRLSLTKELSNSRVFFCADYNHIYTTALYAQLKEIFKSPSITTVITTKDFETLIKHMTALQELLKVTTHKFECENYSEATSTSYINTLSDMYEVVYKDTKNILNLLDLEDKKLDVSDTTLSQYQEIINKSKEHN